MTAVSEPRPTLAPPPPISEAQRSVLYALRRRGEATVDQLAGALGLTVSAIRQHLAALGDLGLVASAEAPRSPPRPRASA